MARRPVALVGSIPAHPLPALWPGLRSLQHRRVFQNITY
jgi:hypothetical protein